MAQFIQFGNRRIQKGLAAACGVMMAVVLWSMSIVSACSAVANAEADAPGYAPDNASPSHVLEMAVPDGQDDMSVAAKGSAAVVLECATGRVLYQNNAFCAMPMASTTKILTAITAIQHLDVNKVVTVAKEAAGVEGSSIYLRKGEQWRVLDLLYGLMLRSGNDAATQLAISTAGSEEAFAALMNDTAYRAGAYRSHFVNPHGLHHDAHYTTAYDLACITAYALRDSLFSRIVSTRNYTFTMPSGEHRTFVNKNKMLASYPGANGVKTGYTKVAGRCLVSSATRDGMQLVSVVLNEYDMWYRSADLLDNAFAAYHMRPLWTAGEVRTVRYRGIPTPVTVQTTFAYPMTDKEFAALRFEFSMLGRESKGAQIGEVLARLDGRVIMRTPVYRVLGQKQSQRMRL